MLFNILYVFVGPVQPVTYPLVERPLLHYFILDLSLSGSLVNPSVTKYMPTPSTPQTLLEFQRLNSVGFFRASVSINRSFVDLRSEER